MQDMFSMILSMQNDPVLHTCSNVNYSVSIFACTVGIFLSMMPKYNVLYKKR